MKVIHFRKLFNTLQNYSVHPRITNAELRISAKEPKEVNEANSGTLSGWMIHASGFASTIKDGEGSPTGSLPSSRDSAQWDSISLSLSTWGLITSNPDSEYHWEKSGDVCPKMLLKRKKERKKNTKNLVMLYYPTPSGLSDQYLEF